MPCYSWNIVESGVKHHKTKPNQTYFVHVYGIQYNIHVVHFDFDCRTMIKNKSNIFNDKNSRISQYTINIPVHVGLKKQAKCLPRH